MMPLFFILLFASLSWGATCSREPLRPIFVGGGSFTSRFDFLENGKDLNKVLKKSQTELDDKGVAPVEVIIPNYIYNYESLAKGSYEVFDPTNPDARGTVAAMVATFYLEQLDDFLRKYNEENLALLEMNLEKWINEDRYEGHEQSVNAVYEYLKPKMLSNQKVLLIGYGLGNWATNGALIKIAQELGEADERFRQVAHVLVSPPRKNIGRLDLTPFTYFSLNADSYQAYQQTFLFKNSLEPNLSLIGNRTSLFYGSLDTYFSKTLEAGVIGSSAKRKPMREHFVDFSRKALDQLKNNDPSCCGGRDGARSINYYGCSEGKTECLGGYVEKGIAYNKLDKSIHIAKDSSVCKSLLHTYGMPRISGNLDIRGKLVLADSASIVGGSSFASPITIDSLDSEIELRGTTTVKSEMGNPLKIKGALLALGSTQLSGKLDINGESYQGNSNQNYKTAFVDAKISGISKITKIQGPVLISGKIKDSEIIGFRDQYNSINNWNILNIDSNADIDNAKISGIGTISAAVNEGATISGNKIRERLDGVVLLDGNESQEKTVVSGIDTKIIGLVYVKNSRITNGSTIWGKYAYTTSASVAITGSEIDNSDVIGAGFLGSELNLTDSLVNGCGWNVQYTQILNSQLYGSRFVNYPLTNQQLGEPSDVETSCAGGISRLSKEFITEGGAEYNRQKIATLFAFP